MVDKKEKTLSIGGATYDLFVRTNHDAVHKCNGDRSLSFSLGGKIQVEGVIETCGGGAANTSVGLSRLGCNACFEGVIGSDQWGEKMIDNFRKENVNTDCAMIVENEVSSFSIILSAGSGERVILYEPGTNEHLHDSNFDRDRICQMDWVYLNHIQSQACVIQDDLIAIFENDCTRLTWNPGGCQIEAGCSGGNNAELLKHTDLLMLNEEESLKFTRKSAIADAIKTLIDAGAKNVCISRGSDGSLASDGKMLYSCPVVTATVVDTTGAGDAFGTGATWGLISGMSLSDSLKAGTLNAASVVGSFGAQTGLLTDTEMKDQLAATSLDVSLQSL